MLLTTPQANPPFAPEASRIPEAPQPPGSRRSARLNLTTQPLQPSCTIGQRSKKKQKQDDPINATPYTSLIPAPVRKGKRMEKGKSVVRGKGRGKVQGSGSGGDDESIDQADDGRDTSYKDSYDLSAESIVQQVSQYSILPKIHRTDL
jgi:hypothetical protein